MDRPSQTPFHVVDTDLIILALAQLLSEIDATSEFLVTDDLRELKVTLVL